MFSVKLDRMCDSCVQLERQMSEMNQLNMDLEYAIRGLSSLSGMDDLMARLRTQKSFMEMEQISLRQMMQGLDKITIDYASCENRICDNSEQSVIRYVRREIGTNDFGKISGILGTMSFI